MFSKFFVSDGLSSVRRGLCYVRGWNSPKQRQEPAAGVCLVNATDRRIDGSFGGCVELADGGRPSPSFFLSCFRFVPIIIFFPFRTFVADFVAAFVWCPRISPFYICLTGRRERDAAVEQFHPQEDGLGFSVVGAPRATKRWRVLLA